MPARRVRFLVELILTAALTVGGIALIYMGRGPVYGGPTPAPRRSIEAAPPTSPGSVAPIALEIPAIGVRTKVISLGLRRDGTIEVPPLGRAAPAGWYRNGPFPGQVGRAVVLGHVDSARDGPAVFYRLRDLTRGARVQVHRADGSTAIFAVTRTDWYGRDAFPAPAVYGPADRPELRLVTCGGTFDRIRHSYRENLVVSADLLSITRRPHPEASA